MQNPTASRKSLVFIDFQLANTNELIEGIAPGVNIIFLDATEMESRKSLKRLPEPSRFPVFAWFSSDKLEACN